MSILTLLEDRAFPLVHNVHLLLVLDISHGLAKQTVGPSRGWMVLKLLVLLVLHPFL